MQINVGGHEAVPDVLLRPETVETGRADYPGTFDSLEAGRAFLRSYVP